MLSTNKCFAHSVIRDVWLMGLQTSISLARRIYILYKIRKRSLSMVMTPEFLKNVSFNQINPYLPKKVKKFTDRNTLLRK